MPLYDLMTMTHCILHEAFLFLSWGGGGGGGGGATAYILFMDCSCVFLFFKLPLCHQCLWCSSKEVIQLLYMHTIFSFPTKATAIINWTWVEWDIYMQPIFIPLFYCSTVIKNNMTRTTCLNKIFYSWHST